MEGLQVGGVAPPWRGRHRCCPSRAIPSAARHTSRPGPGSAREVAEVAIDDVQLPLRRQRHEQQGGGESYGGRFVMLFIGQIPV